MSPSEDSGKNVPGAEKQEKPDSGKLNIEDLKELKFLLRFSRLVKQSRDSFHVLLQEIVNIVPEIFSCSEKTNVRIKLDGDLYSSDGFKESDTHLIREIMYRNRVAGILQIQFEKNLEGDPDVKPSNSEKILLRIVTERIGQLYERSSAENEVLHLNRVLRSMRNVSQIVAETHNQSDLLQKICDMLTDSGGYNTAWIAEGSSLDILKLTVSAGLEKDSAVLATRFKTGEIPACCVWAMESNNLVMSDQIAEQCTGCPLLGGRYTGEGTMAIRLEHEKKIFGVMSVSVPKQFLSSFDEKELFREIAGEISSGLYRIDIEKQKYKAEETLQNKEEWIEGILDNLQAGLVVVDADDRKIVSVNPAVTRMVGLSREEIEGRICHKLICPNEAGNCPIIDKGMEIDCSETVLIRSDGTEVPIIKSVRKMEMDNHVFLVENFIDITRQKEAEEEMREKAEKYFRIFSEFQDLYYQTDMNGIITVITPSVTPITGYTQKELVGRNAAEFCVDTKDSIRFIQKLIRNGSVRGIELRMRKKNGEIVLASINAHVVNDKNGRPVSIAGMLYDITERKRIELALADSEEKFRSITSSAQDAIIMMDNNGCISFINPAAEKMLGHNSDNVIGKDMHTLIAPPSYRKAWQKGMEHFLTTGEGMALGRTLEMEVLRKDGIEIPVELAVSAFQLGGKWNAVGIIRDITNRKRTETELIRAREEAVKASRTKSEFLANMSHEIRTPMNAIIGMADLLWETELSPDQKKYVRIFRNAGEGLLTLINDILDVSIIESGKITLEHISFNLRKLVERTCETLAVRTSEKDMEITYNLEPGVPEYVMGDPSRLRQILVNLIGNAVKFTKKGEVSIQVENDTSGVKQGMLRFSVIDTGIGIPPAKLKIIFDSFTQAESTHTRRFGGTGLGLAISKKLVELMNGCLSVESETGKGSTFSFTCLLDRDDSAHEETIPSMDSGKMKDSTSDTGVAEKAVAGGKNDLSILLVEDSEDNRFLVKAYLKNQPFMIDIADNGMVALEMFRKGKYDLVLMDMQMPVMDGFEATASIRRWETRQSMNHTPIIALTAYALKEEKLKCIEAGCDIHVSKPVKKSELLNAISQAVGTLIDSESDAPDEAVKMEVTIDEDLESLIPGYFKNRQKDIKTIRKELQNGEFELIQRLGHSMKGSGDSYGFKEVSRIGAGIEAAAKEKDSDTIEAIVIELERYVENVEIKYRQNQP